MGKPWTILSGSMLLLVSGCGVAGVEAADETLVVDSELAVGTGGLNTAGISETVHASGTIDRNNPFFQPVGSNPRSCETCHAADQGWTITASSMTWLFLQTQGLAPVFLTHDSGSRPDADTSTLQARFQTWGSTLLKRGVTRFTRNISPNAEFVVAEVNDPYGFSTTTQVSSFRRPTPTVNEAKVSSITWNGGPHDVGTQVQTTAGGATRFHLQRPDALPVEQAVAMREFQMGLFFAQAVDFRAGRLDADGAKGGARNLMEQPFYLGINDLQNQDPAGPYTRKVFNLYDAWKKYDAPRYRYNPVASARAAIYRGQELFNNFEFDISGVKGLNDLLGQETVRGTCSTCHNAPNVGGHSVFRMFDLGTADEPNCGPELPLITLQNKTTGATRRVCDMGRATTTGLWADIGGFRAPPLRGLAARAPYFHDGQAANLTKVIDYYVDRFGMTMNSSQKRDLEAFLAAL